jgi:hypothetical protein
MFKAIYCETKLMLQVIQLRTVYVKYIDTPNILPNQRSRAYRIDEKLISELVSREPVNSIAVAAVARIFCSRSQSSVECWSCRSKNSTPATS